MSILSIEYTITDKGLAELERGPKIKLWFRKVGSVRYDALRTVKEFGPLTLNEIITLKSYSNSGRNYANSVVGLENDGFIEKSNSRIMQQEVR